MPTNYGDAGDWEAEKICIHCDTPKRLHMGKKKYCSSGETKYESKADVRVVRLLDRHILGSEETDFIPLPITDDRNENPDYAAWGEE